MAKATTLMSRMETMANRKVFLKAFRKSLLSKALVMQAQRPCSLKMAPKSTAFRLAKIFS